MPPSASSKRPARSALASVKAPFTWPNSSLSKTPSESPPALTVRSGLPARADAAWSAAATVPLPVPFSPVTSTFASEGPTRSIISSTGCIAGASAISSGRPSSRIARFSASSLCVWRSARPSSTCVRRVARRRALSHGFCTKSRAPRRMASTARSTLPHAVITTTGSVRSKAESRARRSIPSRPDVVSRV